ncbi:hypothetical protein [Gaoshiqia sediminis]|uniref:Outer membrane protein beta-barrel domain-containing protein n=1 Tax=Gaoshiqia sediminis TaxID=2986998 RepID=A0AA42C9Z3_9BACT|nr:hypothetical protein [Gaoshiqia sediminis]MCW0484681.1 hypothetical protein [Gaoshiqia sediminis]
MHRTTKISLTGLFLFMVISVFGQSKIIRNQGFYYTIEATGGIGLTMSTDYPHVDIESFSPANMGIRASANWFQNYHLSLGTSVGYMRYRNPDLNTIPGIITVDQSKGMTTLPVMANVKWFTGKPAKSYFFYAEGGYAIRLEKDRENKGFVYEAGIGYRHQLQARKNFILFKLGYNGFKTNEWIWELTPRGREEHINEYQWYHLDRPTINLTIGFYHSTRY